MIDSNLEKWFERVEKKGIIAKIARKFWKPTSPSWLWDLAYTLKHRTHIQNSD